MRRLVWGMYLVFREREPIQAPFAGLFRSPVRPMVKTIGRPGGIRSFIIRRTEWTGIKGLISKI